MAILTTVKPHCLSIQINSIKILSVLVLFYCLLVVWPLESIVGTCHVRPKGYHRIVDELSLTIKCFINAGRWKIDVLHSSSCQ